MIQFQDLVECFVTYFQFLGKATIDLSLLRRRNKRNSEIELSIRAIRGTLYLRFDIMNFCPLDFFDYLSSHNSDINVYGTTIFIK